MKKQYFADDRDYFKYSILRHLLAQAISITVCWMMTPDDHTGQERRKGYLKHPKKWRSFDPEIFAFLKAQVDGGLADIKAVEREGPISCCRFYGEYIPSDLVSRKRYIDGCLDMASGTDLVFFDPDIGPERKKLKDVDKEEYVLWDEIERTYHRGHSVMVFNLLRGGMRQKNRLVATRRELLQCRLPNADVTVLRSHELAFYFAVHSTHSKAFERAIGTILDSWETKLLMEESYP